MLKTNSKKARENVKQYIINNFTPENYTDAPPEDWNKIARFILDTFRSEKYSRPEDYRYYNYNEYVAFIDWCAGLPAVIDTCYFYNRSAVRDLGEILEQTETKKSLYSESKAEKMLTYLIYNELTRGGAKNENA